MKVYTVLVLDDMTKRISLEPFPTLELALMRACWAAVKLYGVKPNDNVVGQKTGFSDDIEHVIYQDNEMLIISVMEQEMRTALPHFRGEHQGASFGGDLTGSTTPQTVITVAPVDDPKDLDLPAGWQHDGTPVKMDVLFNDPQSIKDQEDLTLDQQYALAIARIAKRPNYSYTSDIGVFVQSSALQELKKRTDIGYEILESEMEFLWDLKREQLNILDVVDDDVTIF